MNKIKLKLKLNDYNRNNNINYTRENRRFSVNLEIPKEFPVSRKSPISMTILKNSIINKRQLKNNYNKNNLVVLFSIILLIAVSSIVYAIPDSLTLQGKLTNIAGAAQEGTFNFTFKIYDSFTEGTVLYQIINRSVKTDANGIYDVILKNLSGLNFSDQYFLGIAVQGDNESKPRINLTSSPYSFRANVSEDLNPANRYEVAVFNITGNLTVGESFADVLTIVTGRLNISDGSITLAGNLTLAEKITFSLGSIIDNLVNGFLRISSGLNVTGNVSIAQDTLFVDNTSGRVGIGTSNPAYTLTVVGNVNVSTTLNVSGNVSFSQLLNCDTINTDATGLLTCGDDATSVSGLSSNFQYSNITEFFGDSGFNGSVLRVGNISVIFEAAYNKANYSAEYASTGFDRENVTEYL